MCVALCFTKSRDIDMGFGFVESRDETKNFKKNQKTLFLSKNIVFGFKKCKNFTKKVKNFKGKFHVVP